MFLLVRFAFSLPILCVAGYYDLKFREVPNKVWLVFLACAVPSLFLDDNLLVKVVSILLIWLLALGFFYFAGLGGADAKALMCLTVAFPDLLWMCAIILVACVLAIATGLVKKKLRDNLPFVAFLTVGLVFCAVTPLFWFQSGWVYLEKIL